MWILTFVTENDAHENPLILSAFYYSTILPVKVIWWFHHECNLQSNSKNCKTWNNRKKSNDLKKIFLRKLSATFAGWRKIVESCQKSQERRSPLFVVLSSDPTAWNLTDLLCVIVCEQSSLTVTDGQWAKAARTSEGFWTEKGSIIEPRSLVGFQGLYLFSPVGSRNAYLAYADHHSGSERNRNSYRDCPAVAAFISRTCVSNFQRKIPL